MNSLGLCHRHRAVEVPQYLPFHSIPVEGESIPVKGYPHWRGSIPSGGGHVRRLPFRAVWQSRTARGSGPRRTSLSRSILPSAHIFPVILEGKTCTCLVGQHLDHGPQTIRGAPGLQVAMGALLTCADPRLSILRWCTDQEKGTRLQIPSPLTSLHRASGGFIHEVVHSSWVLFGMAEGDLFASEMSTHCPHWFSLRERTSPLGQMPWLTRGQKAFFMLSPHIH